MLTALGNATGAAPANESTWFDLLDPTAEERQRVEQAIGISLPEQASIGSVELSQRFARDGDTLRLNVPYFTNGEDVAPTPLGLILSPQHLVSLRYTSSPAFDRAADKLHAAPTTTSAGALAALVEAIVGDIADHMENIAAEVGTLSTRLFGERRRHDRALRTMLGAIGRVEARLTRARLTATGLLRVAMFMHENELDWIAKPALTRLHAAQKDLEVLCELDAQLTDKLQFLLDAALGFISVEQNDVMKVFTVAAVAAIPPVILAGIWGMNFQNMPELHWSYGYPLALTAIALSIIVPLLWFKRRGWI